MRCIYSFWSVTLAYFAYYGYNFCPWKMYIFLWDPSEIVTRNESDKSDSWISATQSCLYLTQINTYNLINTIFSIFGTWRSNKVSGNFSLSVLIKEIWIILISLLISVGKTKGQHLIKKSIFSRFFWYYQRSSLVGNRFVCTSLRNL